MLSYRQEEMIRIALCDENAEEFVLALMNEFAKRSPENCRTILRNGNRIADKMMELQQKEVDSARNAAFMTVVQKEFNTKDYTTYFASMVPVCMVLFPRGTAEGECLALKKYFGEFVKLLHNPKAFDIKRERSWAEHFGYLDYLMLVIQNTKKGDARG